MQRLQAHRIPVWGGEYIGPMFQAAFTVVRTNYPGEITNALIRSWLDEMHLRTADFADVIEYDYPDENGLRVITFTTISKGMTFYGKN